MAPPASPIDVFVSYAHDDATLLQELEKHLTILNKEGLIRSFHAGNVSAGQDWRAAVDGHLDRAEVILALVSADFLASNHCYEVDLAKALARHQAGKAVVIPVLLRACDWQFGTLGGLKALPKDGRPVKSWGGEIDEALTDVARGIREVVTGLLAARSPTSIRVASASGARTRDDDVRRVLQQLGQSGAGVALLAPFGFHAHQVAGEVLHHLQREDEPLLPVRLVPELGDVGEDKFYKRLLRDLRWGLDGEMRALTDGRREPTAMECFEYAVEDLLDGPVRERGRRLLVAIDGFAQVPLRELERWGRQMARFAKMDRGLKMLVWGGEELHDLRTRPPAGGLTSVFHELEAVELGPLSAEEVATLVAQRGGGDAAAAVVYQQTGGHPALVHELVERYPAEVCAGVVGVIAARVGQGEHVERLRRAVEGDAVAKAALLALAKAGAPMVRGAVANEERAKWLGVIRERGAQGWQWTAPVMERLAGALV